jgi:hypothetical protein
MGGFGSGRYGGRPIVENGLALDINRLIRQRCIVAGPPCRYIDVGQQRRFDRLRGFSREPRGSLGAASLFGERHARGLPGAARDVAAIMAARRWWWICPQSGRRVTKLHLPPGAAVFAARRAYRLQYRNQRITALDRSHDRLRRLYRKLGEDYHEFGQPPPRRPKGMHLRTYERLTAELYEAM